MNNFKNKKILVTGHTGFKGFWLSLILKKMGADVYGLSLKPLNNQKSHFRDINGGDLIKSFYMDIKNLENVNYVIKEIKPDLVFHLAAQAIVSESFSNPINTFYTNTLGSINLLESIRNNLDKTNIIMITSDKVYENVEWIYGYRENDKLGGKDPYSASKSCAEIAIRSYFHSFFKNTNIKLVIARAGNVVGGGDWSKDRLIPDCINAWLNKSKVIIRSPNSTRPWQHVFDPINGYLKLAEYIENNNFICGESFNFGPYSANEVNVLQMVKLLSEYWDGYSEFKVEIKQNFEEAKLLKLNCDKSHSILGWQPLLDFRKCISMTAEWYKYSLEGSLELENITNEQISWFLKSSNR